jgi:hypothetical protein
MHVGKKIGGAFQRDEKKRTLHNRFRPHGPEIRLHPAPAATHSIQVIRGDANVA